MATQIILCMRLNVTSQSDRAPEMAVICMRVLASQEGPCSSWPALVVVLTCNYRKMKSGLGFIPRVERAVSRGQQRETAFLSLIFLNFILVWSRIIAELFLVFVKTDIMTLFCL